MKNVILVAMVVFGLVQIAEAREYRVNMPDGTYASCKSNAYTKDMAGFIRDGKTASIGRYYHNGWCLKVDKAGDMRKKNQAAARRAKEDKEFMDKRALYRAADIERARKQAKLDREQNRLKAIRMRQKEHATKTKREAFSEKYKYDTATYACSKNINCWSDRYKDKAFEACKSEIVSYAKNNYRWKDVDPFTNSYWTPDEAGRITYFGDAVEFMNGYGGWFPYKYSCIYDTESGYYEVGLQKGRL